MQKESRADNLNRKMKKSCHQEMFSSFVKYIIHEVYITLQLSMIYPVIYLHAIQQKSRPGSSCLEYQTQTGKICNSKSRQCFRTASLVTRYIEFRTASMIVLVQTIMLYHNQLKQKLNTNFDGLNPARTAAKKKVILNHLGILAN